MQTGSLLLAFLLIDFSEHYVCTLPAQERKTCSNWPGKIQFLLDNKAYQLCANLRSGTLNCPVVACPNFMSLETQKNGKKKKLPSYFLCKKTYKPAFSIQFIGSNEAVPAPTQADFMYHDNDIQLKYIDDCQLKSYCTFKVPINSDCQGLVCFCVCIFHSLLSAQDMTLGMS